MDRYNVIIIQILKRYNDTDILHLIFIPIFILPALSLSLKAGPRAEGSPSALPGLFLGTGWLRWSVGRPRLHRNRSTAFAVLHTVVLC